MKTALFFAIVAALFLLVALYFFDLLLFFHREKKRFDQVSNLREYVSYLEKKQKKAKHPKKKNYYLYLLCLAWLIEERREKAQRLAPFLKKDALLGVPDDFVKQIADGGK